MKANRRPTGMALAATLVFVAVLFVGATALGTIAINNLTSVRISSNGAIAMQAAEAGLAIVTSYVNDDHYHGTHGETASGTLTASSATWTVSFSDGSGTPEAYQSVNNLNGSATVIRSDGTRVPPGTCDIIITTNVQSPNRNIPKLGCVLSLNSNWKAAVASSGVFAASGGLTVEGARDLDAARRILSGLALPTDYIPGVLAANSTGNPSIKTAGSASFPGGGYVVTPGTAKVPSYVPVYNDTTPIPKVTYAFYTPDTTAVNVITLSTMPSSLTTSGPVNTYYYNGNLSVSGGLDVIGTSSNPITLCVNGSLSVSGGLNLQNATIYTNGSFNVSGGVKDHGGKGSCSGSIFVCGTGHDFNVSGASTIDASSSSGVSVYSQGDINMTGGATLQGLVYARGDVNATGGATMVGIVVADGNTNTEVGVTGGATFIYVPIYSSKLMQSTARLQKLSWRIIDQ
jgi:hypothetical protein